MPFHCLFKLLAIICLIIQLENSIKVNVDFRQIEIIMLKTKKSCGFGFIVAWLSNRNDMQIMNIKKNSIKIMINLNKCKIFRLLESGGIYMNRTRLNSPALVVKLSWFLWPAVVNEIIILFLFSIYWWWISR